MRSAKLALMVAIGSLLLAGCGGNKEPNLMNLRSDTNGPDEFGILPVKALEMPKDIASLPEPTPNGTNLVDPTPIGDAIAALGGKTPNTTGVAKGDSAIISYASRKGVSADIRSALAVDDLKFRRKNNGLLLERLFKNTVYFKAYRRLSLNQQAELARWRAAGVATPSAPPVKKR